MLQQKNIYQKIEFYEFYTMDYDWRANGEVDYDTMDIYSTIAIRDKIQTLVSWSYANKNENNESKPFLKDNDQWDNTMIIVTSDNGSQGFSNYPSVCYPFLFLSFLFSVFLFCVRKSTWIYACCRLGGADMDAIDSSLSTYGTTNKKSEFSLSTLLKWLIYGNLKGNQRQMSP